MKTEEVHVQIVVKGLVQGVGFRWFVAHHAEALHLRGYVSNLYNGDVKIEAEGNKPDLEELIKQVKIGPRASRVTAVGIEWSSVSNSMDRYTGFEIR
jgi:acylphosphatase